MKIYTSPFWPSPKILIYTTNYERHGQKIDPLLENVFIDLPLLRKFLDNTRNWLICIFENISLFFQKQRNIPLNSFMTYMPEKITSKNSSRSLETFWWISLWYRLLSRNSRKGGGKSIKNFHGGSIFCQCGS